jgi:hypothetical protein
MGQNQRLKNIAKSQSLDYEVISKPVLSVLRYYQTIIVKINYEPSFKILRGSGVRAGCCFSVMFCSHGLERTRFAAARRQCCRADQYGRDGANKSRRFESGRQTERCRGFCVRPLLFGRKMLCDMGGMFQRAGATTNSATDLFLHELDLPRL